MTADSPPSAGTNAATPSRRLSFLTKTLYASGSVGNAIKKGGLAGFLLIYYNQVVGLDAAMVGAVLGFAVILDGFLDPIIGYWSDNTRSRLGRRHPFLYASIIPVSIGFALLWMAPQTWSPAMLLVYMTALVVVVRVFDTFFEVPAAALLAELTQEYDERTALTSMRYIFGVIGAYGMRILAYGVFLAPTLADPSGITNREGFATYGLVSGIVIFTAITCCCLGTHGQIHRLHTPPQRRHGLLSVLKEAAVIFTNRSMLSAAGAAMFMTVGLGSLAGLQVYLKIYFWGLTAKQVAVIVPLDMAGGVLGALSAMHISRRLGKRNAAVLALLLSYVGLAAPLLLRFAGQAPPPDDPMLLVLLGAGNFVMESGRVIFSILLVSMMLDVVEEAQLKTGRRSEGLILSADNVLQKAVAGMGVFISGLILTFVDFPRGAKPGSVAPEVIDSLGAIVLVGLAPFYAAAAITLMAYVIDRRRHEANVAALSRSRGEAS
ncbi:MFS transporter [Phenylobacterium sp.]|uniref:MFS transporter n=1 Tax=Phenylobacterium sp. TaxID=1871053 RepID=UPI00301E108C